MNLRSHHSAIEPIMSENKKDDQDDDDDDDGHSNNGNVNGNGNGPGPGRRHVREKSNQAKKLK